MSIGRKGDSMSCDYEARRDEIIDAYVRNRLSEADRDAFDVHLYDCDACFEALQQRQALAAAVRRQGETQPASIRPLRQPLFTFRRAAVLAAAALLVFAALLSYEAMLPDFYDPAKLSQGEKDNLLDLTQRRGEAENPLLEAGVRTLLEAETARLLIVPAFKQAKLDTAIANFRAIYDSTDNIYLKSTSAYFLGKAYLMRAEPDSACTWLQRVLDQPATFYRQQATELRQRLACAAG